MKIILFFTYLFFSSSLLNAGACTGRSDSYLAYDFYGSYYVFTSSCTCDSDGSDCGAVSNCCSPPPNPGGPPGTSCASDIPACPR